jgi:urease accessory protein
MSRMLRIERLADHHATETGAQTVPLPKLVLPFDLRQKSRLRATLSDGTEATLYMPRGTVLSDGDILQAEDGTLVRVESSPEKVLVVTASTPFELIKAAYHLGNRHTPVEFGEGYLKIESDQVLEQMLVQLGVAVKEEFAPFQPERGAYGGGHKHGHDETFAEDHALANQLFHEHHGYDHSDQAHDPDKHSPDDFDSHGHS